MRLLFVRELGAARDVVPLLEAAAAAGSRRVLRDEDGMSTPGRLLAVVRGMRRREPRRDEVARMNEHRRHSLLFEIRPLCWTKPELSPKRRSGEPGEYIV